MEMIHSHSMAADLATVQSIKHAFSLLDTNFKSSIKVIKRHTKQVEIEGDPKRRVGQCKPVSTCRLL
jgi:hypothetical protein